MADVYYRLGGGLVYYSNEAKEGYTKGAQHYPGVGGRLVLELTNDKFVLPEDARWLFKGASSIENIEKIDTSQCVNMGGMFERAGSSVPYLDLRAFTDLSKVTNMDAMFNGLGTTKVLVPYQTDGSTMVAPGCTSNNMFLDCIFDDFDPTQIDISKANNMGGYFGIVPEFRTAVTYEKQNGSGRQVTQVYEKYNNAWIKSDPGVKVG